MRKFTFTLSMFLLCIIFAPSVFAIEITTSVGNGADSHIFRLDPNSTHGGSGELAVKNDIPGQYYDRKAYIRFDLNEISGFVLSAQFKLSIQAYGDGHPQSVDFLVYGLNDGHSGENWLENEITWSNAPSNILDGDVELISGDVTFLGTITLDMTLNPVGSLALLDSPELTNFIMADSNDMVTLIIVRVEESRAGTNFAPKEVSGFTPPTLVLDGVVGSESSCLSGVKALYR